VTTSARLWARLPSQKPHALIFDIQRQQRQFAQLLFQRLFKNGIIIGSSTTCFHAGRFLHQPCAENHRDQPTSS
jgi:hypothetical protein